MATFLQPPLEMAQHNAKLQSDENFLPGLQYSIQDSCTVIFLQDYGRSPAQNLKNSIRRFSSATTTEKNKGSLLKLASNQAATR